MVSRNSDKIVIDQLEDSMLKTLDPELYLAENIGQIFRPVWSPRRHPRNLKLRFLMFLMGLKLFIRVIYYTPEIKAYPQ